MASKPSTLSTCRRRLNQWSPSQLRRDTIRSRTVWSRSSSSSSSTPMPHSQSPPLVLDITGTVPYHSSTMLIQHPSSPQTYPTKLDDSFSKYYRRLTGHGASRKMSVNFFHIPPPSARQSANGMKLSLKEDSPDAGTEREEDYPYLLFGQDGQGRNGLLLKPYAEEGEPRPRRLLEEIETPEVTAAPIPITNTKGDVEGASVLLLVCTHGSRDCRCGDTGGKLVRALQEELERRKKRWLGIQWLYWSGVTIGEIAHVGGHKYAANLLAFPHGDWLGNLRPQHAPQILDAVMQWLSWRKELVFEADVDDLKPAMQLPPLIADRTLWRGRMGMTKEEQLRLMDQYENKSKD